MESNSVTNKKVLLETVLSWPFEDIFNSDLYRDKVINVHPSRRLMCTLVVELSIFVSILGEDYT